MASKARRSAVLVMALSVVVGAAWSNACSSDSEEETPKKQDAGNDAGAGGAAGAGGTGTGGTAAGGTGAGGAGGSGGGACQLAGSSCASHSDCCSANCDPTLNACANPAGACKSAGDACSVATDCCTLVCSAGKCGSTQCASDLAACTTDAECCGGKCGAGGAGCTPLNSACKTAGNTCSAHGDCCSKLCQNGKCSGQPSFCNQTGDLCSTDIQCCTGICNKASGATLGTCKNPNAPGTTGCLVAGQVCGAGAKSDGGVVGDGGVPACGGECCSRACAPHGPTGVLICQPPSGCHPTGEACVIDSDCCGSPGMPGGNGSVKCSKAANEPVGRCDNGNACRPAGAVCKLASGSCNAENNCCAGNVNQDPSVCQQDLLGIPRCTGVGNCADAGSQAGKSCATSADCCGLPCVPNPSSADGGALYVCGATCVPSGGTCTSNADCCSGLPCKAPPGSTQGVCGSTELPDGGVGGSGGTGGTGGSPSGGTGGTPTCSLYGQSCTTSANCCNNVPCTAGHCVYPIQ